MNRPDLLMKPVRIRVLQYLSIHKQASPGEMIASLKDVSKASVYNHIKILEENGILQVVKENRIRGTVEKIYRMTDAHKFDDFQSIAGFLLLLLLDFQKYYEKNGTLGKELFFAGRDYLCLKDEDFRCFLEEYTALCRKYYEKESRDGKMRSISIISSPVQEEEK